MGAGGGLKVGGGGWKVPGSHVDFEKCQCQCQCAINKSICTTLFRRLILLILRNAYRLRAHYIKSKFK